jgi:hypothetical protein
MGSGALATLKPVAINVTLHSSLCILEAEQRTWVIWRLLVILAGRGYYSSSPIA